MHRRVYSRFDTQAVPVLAHKHTIRVRCTQCGEISDVPVSLSTIDYFTPNGDGTYTSPFRECIICREWNDRLYHPAILITVGLVAALSGVLMWALLAHVGGW